jgi:hypothetical protein
MRLEGRKESAAPKLSGRRVSGRCLCGAVELKIDFPAFWAWHDHSADQLLIAARTSASAPARRSFGAVPILG